MSVYIKYHCLNIFSHEIKRKTLYEAVYLLKRIPIATGAAINQFIKNKFLTH